MHSSITPEPFELVSIEAMILRKPTVATRLGGAIETIDGGQDGNLFRQANPEMLAVQRAAPLADLVLWLHVGEARHVTGIERCTSAHALRIVECIHDEAWH